MKPHERDEFYLSQPDAEDDGEEYELEPPDPEVVAAQERRGRETIEASRTAIDIDDIYRDAGRQRSDEILEGWLQHFRHFRFQVRHLIIATAVVAIFLTLAKLQLLGVATVLLVMFGVAGLFFYLQWQEQKAEDEATRRREAMYAQRRAYLEKTTGRAGALPSTFDDMYAESEGAADHVTRRTTRPFQFSVFEMMVALTAAALLFGLVRVLGGPSNTASLLGFVALIGLIVHALGVEPPGIVVLGWWFALILYVLLSVAVAVFPSLA